ncbi:MAG: substrate-binding domain-containing protein [Bacteroidia bacterium]|nr:substrate-binding domain-containing protein [Bacteroidia bacterium]
MIRFFTPTLMAVLFLLWSGCGESTSGNKKLRIAVIPKGTTHIFWKSVHAGAKKAEHDLGVEINWQGPLKESDRQIQIQIVQNFISQNMDAIVLAPLDSRSLVPVVKSAGKRNLPVIIFDSDLDSDDYKSFVATDNYKGGQLCAELLAQKMNNKGKAILMRYVEGSASTTHREQGFLDRIAEVAPDIELISTNQYAGVTLERGLQVAQNLLNRFPEVQGIYCPNETSVQSMLRALQTAGKAGEVVLIGFDANETLIQGIKDGELHGIALQDPFMMGYLGVETAVKAARGEPIEKRIDTGVVIVTKDNMSLPEIQKLLYPEVEKWLGE